MGTLQQTMAAVLSPSQLVTDRQVRTDGTLTPLQQNLRNGLTASQLVDNWSGTTAQLSCNISLDDVIRREGIPTLADVNRVYGNTTSVRIITGHLQSVLNYAGVELAPAQLAETSLAILSSYYFLNLAELCIFFTQLKNGSRGQFVWGSKVNNQAIMVALHDFCLDRGNAYRKLEQENIRIAADRNYSRIENAAAAMIKGIDSIRELKEKAKTDYSAFRTLFPMLPDNYKPEDLFGAYGEKETVIRTIYGENTPPPGVASEDIYRFLCDYNVKMNRK